MPCSGPGAELMGVSTGAGAVRGPPSASMEVLLMPSVLVRETGRLLSKRSRTWSWRDGSIVRYRKRWTVSTDHIAPEERITQVPTDSEA